MLHADWSVEARKRRLARAEFQPDGGLVAFAPRPAGDPLQGCGRPVLVGFDFPIGVPRGYATEIGASSFRALLGQLGSGRFARFFDVADRPDEVCAERPFYPRRPGGRRRADSCYAGLLRRCDAEARAAPLFWTLGAQQVGRAALHGWREVIVPALSEVALWPFDGTLRDLLARGGIVVTETYPREAYRRLGIAVKRKGERRERAAAAPALLRFAAGIRARLDPALVTAIESGFVSDDDFDAVIGLFGMLDVVRRGRSGEPDDDGVRRVEGWMLGLGSGGPPSGLPSRSDRGGPSYP